MSANGFRAKQEAVRSLILEARQYVSIRRVYLDRGFYQVHVVAELEQLEVDFIVRARPSKGMKVPSVSLRFGFAPTELSKEMILHRPRFDSASTVQDGVDVNYPDWQQHSPKAALSIGVASNTNSNKAAFPIRRLASNELGGYHHLLRRNHSRAVG